MIDFSFNEDENILYVKRYGDIYLEDILKIIDDINKTFKNNRYVYILQDTTESSMKYNMEDLSVMINDFKQRLEDFDCVKIANFTKDPVETATAIVFEEQANQIGILHHKTFSTFEYAKHWLQKSMIMDEEYKQK